MGNEVMTDDRWIRRFVPAPAATARLVCLPHAGGSASYYLPVAKALAPRVEVLAIQYPGRQDRRTEPCLQSCQEMAAGVFDAIQPYLDKPLTLFGHSMGASVSYELLRELEAAGTRPTALFASGRRAPGLNTDEGFHLLDDKGLIAEVKRLGGAGSHLLDDEEIVSMVLPSIRSDYRAAETYTWTPGPKLTTPIFAFVGDADPKVSVDQARAWSEYTEGAFESRVFPGDHFYIDTNADAVIKAIATHIEADQAVRS
ncbi:thioesterase II family protein [Kibdelosporangium phytohabitans]|uniref:Oleoyl-ACP hydrolase n=1 Tax=Kibdelosporangium phytohabitans TaxID=860235 RepID=A0A0N9HPM8_9PSEU|nr:alpha/beta fold hydrolase [Kibdelosporangium phytohabitans]ALG08988.1 oleoyl-ACP hydrolase [Kibdelosporangium phytohabitans]MBE1469835.1 surfactin synthase thioesterase subunit [Kibdelosporangium phytohabitans]